ncbi:aminotransferase class IV [Streptomyces globisporus]|uniref:aminotransferase class IV n=1 Tax=Streptomyces globisporus TaxID=1908 RepID=UPI0004CBC7BD|nr:aminotransferase class IV [Streptomyces globisporus]
MTTPPAHIEIDGTPAADPQLLAALMGGYGHFTAMQVRDGRVKGLGLHLDRLDRSTRELFGRGLEGGRVRELVAGALANAGRRDASVRVYVYPGVRTVVTVAGPAPVGPGAPQRLTSVDYWRPAPHIKHLGGFGQRFHGDAARRAGYDEALLTSPDGEIAEGAVTNIAFWDGTSVVWPSAPCLTGITMALLERHLESVRRPVTLADLPGYRAAFVTNSRTIAPVTAIDEVAFAVDEELMGRVFAAYGAVEGAEIRP